MNSFTIFLGLRNSKASWVQEDLDKMNVDNFPKSIKRSVRYIKQDATLKQLEEIKKVMDYAIKKGASRLQNKC